MTPKKEKAVLLLATGHKHIEVAKQLGITAATICNWLKEDDFKVEINISKTAHLNSIRDGFFHLGEKAKISMEELLESDNDMVKLQTCKLVFNSLGLSEGGFGWQVGPTNVEELQEKERNQHLFDNILNLLPPKF